MDIMTEEIRKPEIGDKVYCIYEDSIQAEEVYAVGKDVFFLDFHDRILEATEYYYEDYGNTWFYSEQLALKRLAHYGQGILEFNPQEKQLVIVRWPCSNANDSFYYELQDWYEDSKAEDFGDGIVVYRIE